MKKVGEVEVSDTRDDAQRYNCRQKNYLFNMQNHKGDELAVLPRIVKLNKNMKSFC